MSSDGLDVVLASLADQYGTLDARSAQSGRASRETQADIDDLDERVAALGERPRTTTTDTQRTDRAARSADELAPLSWAETAARANDHLRQRGVDPSTVDIDQLLDAETIQRIERRHQSDFSLRTHLDRYDVLALVLAGLTATALDALIVRVPADTAWYGAGETIGGSPLTKSLRRLSVDSDNWLSEWAKVSYDRIVNLPEPVKGLAPRTHRVQTLGHDPLLGLVFGTLDVLRGTMTAVPRSGGLVLLDTADPIPNPLIAFARQVLHLFSDVPTKVGLPLPGWVALATVEVGKFGPDNLSVGATARRMYLNGYDSWHFLTMSTSVAALELVLRCYWGVRKVVDEKWAADIDAESVSPIAGHPRFCAMALGANAVAAAGNLGKIAALGGNPLAINYVQWLSFLRAFYRWAQKRTTTPGSVLEPTARANALAIEEGWHSFDFTDPDFPSIG